MTGLLRIFNKTFFWPLLAVLAADLATKDWAMSSLVSGNRPVIPGLLYLRLIRNEGGLLGLLAGQPWLLAGVVFFGAAAILIWQLYGEEDGPWFTFGRAIVLAGALGNLVDRVTLGYVVDWIALEPFPGVFNLADVAVRAGWLLLLVLLLRPEGKGAAGGRAAR